jgi:Flp pilus assembly protein TadG
MMRRHRDRGAGVVELVLIAPVLVLILMFLVVVGRLAEARLQLSEATHSAARAASMASSPSQARSAASIVLDTLPASAACARRDVKVDSSQFKPGGAVRVVVSCHIRLDDLAGVVPGTTTITESSASPIDPFRAVDRGFVNSEGVVAANRSMGVGS